MIGVDLVYIPEMQSRLESGDDIMLEKMFSLDELRDKSPEHLAGIWAAKEAVRKSLDEAPEKWTDIRILYNANGKPRAQLGDMVFDVSISHHGAYAVAVAQQIDSTA